MCFKWSILVGEIMCALRQIECTSESVLERDCACVCVCVRETERKRKKEKRIKRDTHVIETKIEGEKGKERYRKKEKEGWEDRVI